MCMLLRILFVLISGMTVAQTSPDSLKKRVETLVNTYKNRYHKDTASLNACSEYIYSGFKQAVPNVFFQEYEVNGWKYRNVIARIGDPSKPVVVIGAHYDVCDSLPGADDNASGVAGILEAAVQLKDYKGEYCLELVAYTLEEPPYFGTQAMGSYIHAENLNWEKRDVAGMVSVEMIGYFSDEEGSQGYPYGIMRWFYGDKGDYILLTKKMFNGNFTRHFSRGFRKSGHIRTKKIGAPKSLTGIDFSDHRNYWLLGYDALMLTDTSFYRNHNYHRASDTPDTLDYKRMAKVVDALVAAIQAL